MNARDFEELEPHDIGEGFTVDIQTDGTTVQFVGCEWCGCLVATALKDKHRERCTQ